MPRRRPAVDPLWPSDHGTDRGTRIPVGFVRSTEASGSMPSRRAPAAVGACNGQPALRMKWISRMFSGAWYGVVDAWSMIWVY